MDIKQVILGGIFGVVLQLGAAMPEISSVVAQQRYQSNGLVDVTVTMQGASNDVARAVCTFVATNSATKSAISVAHIMQNGDVAGEGTIWTRKFIWDAKADVGEVKIDDVALTVVVDLSLGGVQLWENGPYWAECNVGATKPEEYGYYFWWGDAIGYKRSIYGWLISVKDSSQLFFSSENCPTYDMDNSLLYSEGYIDSTGNLAAAHDAATVDLGGPWRMPTGDEFLALVNNCQTTWTTCNGVNGRMVTGKGAYSSKSIFLPAAGSVEKTEVFDLGSRGRYWSSSPTSGFPKCTEALLFDASGFSAGSNSRYAGQPIRPVREFATSMADGATIHVALDFRVQPLPQGGPYTETVDGIEWTFMVNADLEVRVGGVSASRAISQSTTGEIAIPSELGGRPVTSIGVEAFRGCCKLTSVTIPEGVTSIGGSAFDCCRGLTSVTIPSSVTSIGGSAFYGTPFYDNQSDGMVIFGKVLYKYKGDCPSAVTIPSSVANICERAFDNCSGLTSVTIPTSVGHIEQDAFLSCRDLFAVDFKGAPPEGVSVAAINADAAIRYNAKYENEWLPVISKCGWTNATPYTPDSDSVVPTLQELASAFGKDSDVVKNIKSEAELATFNGFLKNCSIGSADDLTEGQRQFAYQSFKLAEITTAPQLFEDEPVLKIEDVELSGGNLSVTISLTAGAEAIQLAKDKLAEKIRVGTSLGDITGKPTIVASPSADGTSLTFSIIPPEGDLGFVKVLID